MESYLLGTEPTVLKSEKKKKTILKVTCTESTENLELSKCKSYLPGTESTDMKRESQARQTKTQEGKKVR